MKLPKQIEANKKRTDQILEQIKGPQPPTELSEEGTSPPVEGEVTKPELTPAIDWEHKFKTIEGMWKAEKRQWLTEKETMFNRLTTLETQAKKVYQDRPVEFNLDTILSPEESENYDVGQKEVLRKVAVHAVQEAVGRFKEEVEADLQPIRDSLKTQQTDLKKGKETLFYETLKTLVPDWQSINDSQKFHEWLAQEDEMTSYQRQSILESHYNKFDATKTAKMFVAFKNTLPVAKKPGSVVPDTLPSVPSNQPTTERVRASDIRKFYNESARGVWKSRPEEYKRLKSKFDKAIVEGRVLQGQ